MGAVCCSERSGKGPPGPPPKASKVKESKVGKSRDLNLAEVDEAPQKPQKGKKTAILIHGLSGSAMTFTSEKCIECGGDGRWGFVECSTCSGSGKTPPGASESPSWCDISMFMWGPSTFTNSLKCQIKEVDGLPKAMDAEGITVNVVQGRDGIDSVNPFDSSWDDIECFRPMIDGLSKDFNVECMNYDWRKWGCPHFSKTIPPRFKALVEKAKRESGCKVTIVGHSMGCGMACLCMHDMGEKWQKEYVEDVILVAPANMGSPSMLSSLGFSPVVNSSSMFESLKLGNGLAQTSATWPCMIQELPLAVGGIHCFEKDHVFARTSKKNYKIDDMDDFMKDMQELGRKNNDPRETGPAFYRHAKANADRMKAPMVPITLMFNDAHDTVSTLNYIDVKDDLMACPTLEKGKKGDGTIVAESVVRMGLEWRKLGRDVTIINTPDKNNHKDLCGGEYSVEVIGKIMHGVDVKDHRENIRLVNESLGGTVSLSEKPNSHFAK